MGREKEPKKCGVYQIMSICDPSRVYIGSSVDIKKRWYHHKYRLKKGDHHSPFLQRHVNKYGIDDIVFKIIEQCCEDLLNERENFYIKLFHPLFNVCKEAGSTKGNIHTKETRLKISKKLKGVPLTQEHKDNMSKPVFMFSINGVFIKEFKSVSDAEKSGFNKACIYSCCCGKSNTHKNYIWSFINDISIINKISIGVINSPIKQVSVFQSSLDGVIIKKWPNTRSAAKATGASPGKIIKCCDNKSFHAKGFLWSRNKEDIPEKVVRYKSFNRRVAQVSADGHLIKIWDNANTPNNFGFKHSPVFACCTGVIRTYKGFMWIFERDLEDYGLSHLI